MSAWREGRFGRRIGARVEFPANQADHSEADLCANAISADNTPAATAVVQLKLFVRAIDYDAAYPSARSPAFGRDVIATSHPLASQAGMAMLMRGGNAVDAAAAGDGPHGGGVDRMRHWRRRLRHRPGPVRVVWSEFLGPFAGRLDARPLRRADAMPRGWDSVTVPGAVAARAKLARRFERLQLVEVATPAIDARRWS